MRPTHLERQKQAREALGRDNAVRCTKEEDMARPEWAKECDINVIVNRVMAGQYVPTRQVSFGVADYTQDMETMRQAADALAAEYNELPEDIKEALTPQDYLKRAINLESNDPKQLRLELEALQKDTQTEETPAT